MTNDEIKNRSTAEAYLQDHPHEILIKAIAVFMERYDLDDNQVQDLIKSYILCVSKDKRTIKVPANTQPLIIVREGSGEAGILEAMQEGASCKSGVSTLMKGTLTLLPWPNQLPIINLGEK